jgi:tRNA-5-taurinomethyluridine 2-sulfurtransferase
MNTAILVSGGVDSSVALHLLKEQGHTLTAFYLKIWLEDELSFLGTCPWQEDLRYVESVCKQIQTPLEVISLQREYWDRVVAYTLEEIRAGKTPNPDMLCNQQVKFGAFLDKIDSSFTSVATGHYAQTKIHNNQVLLCRAQDSVKDQTYFLSQLNQEQLSRALFPIGHLTKAQVRDYAAHAGLLTHDRKDSQGICFLGKLKFSEFLRYHLGDKSGEIREFETGKKLGAHKGYWYYTPGQRQGLGLPGGPWYVVAKNIQDNCVFVSKNYYTQDKPRDTFEVVVRNWIAQPPPLGKPLQVKLRHGATDNTCTLQQLTDTKYKVMLAQRDQGIAPGQFAVFYDNNLCLGGGVITNELDSCTRSPVLRSQLS